MNLLVMVALGMLWFAVALGAPVAENELRQGRDAFRRLEAAAAARGALADLEQGLWIGAAAATPPGGYFVLPTVALRPMLRIAPELWRIGGDLWLAAAAATLSDRGGNVLAGSRQGVLLRVVQPAADSVPRAVPTTRPWVVGFQ